MRGGPVFSARIKYAGRCGPARVMRALCGTGRPTLPPLVFSKQLIDNGFLIIKYLIEIFN